MSVEDRAISLVEGDQPKLGFLLTTVNEQTGATANLLVAGSDFRFVVRNANADVVAYLSTGVTPAIVKTDPNRLDVQIGVAATATPTGLTPYRYFLQIAPAGTTVWRTLRRGTWIVEDF